MSLTDDLRASAKAAFGGPRSTPDRAAIVAAAQEVIAAADNTYGPRWRQWHRAGGAGSGAQRLSRALVALEDAADKVARP